MSGSIREQPIDVALLKAFLTLAGDPDTSICDLSAAGVPLGVDCELPRVPEVYEEKTKWKNAPLEDHEVSRWMENYGSVDDHVEAVRAQFTKDQAQGWMAHCPLEEAKLRWPGRLRIAGLGAIEKKPGSK